MSKVRHTFLRKKISLSGVEIIRLLGRHSSSRSTGAKLVFTWSETPGLGELLVVVVAC